MTGIVLKDNLGPDGDTEFVNVQNPSQLNIRLIINY